MLMIKDFLLKKGGHAPEIEHNVMLQYLEQEGFRYEDDLGLLKIEGGFVHSFDKLRMTRWLRDNVFSQSGVHMAIFAKSPERYFVGNSQMRLFRGLGDVLLRDSKKDAFLPFRNGLMRITADHTEFLEAEKYLKAEGKVLFADAMIEHDIIVGSGKGAFQQFCEKAVGKDGMVALMSSIGYMLHNHKEESIAKMVVFSDIGGDLSRCMPDGGSGKSLIAKVALSKVRKCHYIDGKQFKVEDRFRFQGITSQHSIVCIEDIRKDFDNTDLFNLVTGDMSIRSMFKAVVTIPFKNSPKIIVTANSGVAIDSGSEKRRVNVVGFSDHYNYEHTPIDEFKHTFFTDWNTDQWNRFYNFMADCIKIYLKRGLCAFGTENVQIKHLYERFGNVIIDRVLEPDIKGLLTDWHTIRAAYAAVSDYGEKNETELTAYKKVTRIMEGFGYICAKEFQYAYDKNGRKIVNDRKRVYKFMRKEEFAKYLNNLQAQEDLKRQRRVAKTVSNMSAEQKQMLMERAVKEFGIEE